MKMIEESSIYIEITITVISCLFDRKSHSHAFPTNIAQSSDQLVTFAKLNAQDAQRVVACFLNICFDLITALQNSELAGDAL